MPIYEFECLDCKEIFTVVLTLSERGKVPVRCPKCSGARVEQRITSFIAKTASKT